MVAALTLIMFIVVGGPIIVKIPIAALVGVMFMVVIGTFEWSTFRTFGSVREFSERLWPANDPDEVIIDFKDARVADYSSLEVLNVITECQKMITAAGIAQLFSGAVRQVDGKSKFLIPDRFPGYFCFQTPFSR